MKEKILSIIADLGDLEASKIDTSAKFTELGFDSLATVELIMAFEKEFNISIPDTEMEKIVTVEDAIKYIESHG